MADSIAHRGPDAEGFWVGEGVGLAHRRLSIIDLAGGDQPMRNEDGSVRVVFNGEIYNYPHLRDVLLAKGHTLRTKSDTEVLVHLYEDHGAALVEKLRGMFAFALWDVRRRRLLLARDRVGQKPLYYYRDRNRFLFGSEIKAILACPDVDRTIDQEALESYLTWGVVPGEKSIFKHVRKLPPAHYLEVAADNHLGGEPRRYWGLQAQPDDSRSLDDWCEALDDKFRETVQAHRIADVPVGAFLSGGVDSGAIVAEMARLGGGSLKTFSVGFDGDPNSELPQARLVAERYQTEHVEEVVATDVMQGLESLVHFYDEPFADPSAIPTMRVAKVASESVKVVVSGDGGDEAFGGYTRYAHDLREDAVRRRLPSWLRRPMLAAVARAWPEAAWAPRPLRAKTTLTNLSLNADEAYANTLSLFRRPLRRRLLNKADLNGYRPESAVTGPYASGRDALQSMTASDIAMLLPDDFLTKVDRASMAVGLEVRPPLVDHELLEMAWRSPSEWKIRDGETKWIFKKLQEDRLPPGAVWRKKQGFDSPVDAWMRGPLRERLEQAASPRGALSTHIDVAEMSRLTEAHLRGAANSGRQLWALLVLDAWLERYESPPIPTAPRYTTSLR